MEKYKNEEGKIGVLISANFGGGWSTWSNSRFSEFYLMDKRLVEMKINDEDENSVKEYCKSQTKQNIYMGGWRTVEVVWLDEGEHFFVNEHEGSESIFSKEDLIMQA